MPAGSTLTGAVGMRDDLTHRGNLRSSRFGWLRLTPMYSVHLVEGLLSSDRLHAGRVLDPFCGTGTTALVCAQRGVPCDTTDINPFLLWLTATKTHAYTCSDLVAAREASSLVAAAAGDESRGVGWVPSLRDIEKWWEPDVLAALSRAWAVIRRLEAELAAPAAWLLVIAFLRASIRTAHVSFGHQSMSFRQNGARARQSALFSRGGGPAVVAEWNAAFDSIAAAATSPILEEPREFHCDARNLSHALEAASYTKVVTSPPYCNRMSYIRELRPYMYWTGFLSDARSAGDLDWLAIGGTWGIATSKVARWEPPAPVEVPFEGFDQLVARVAESSDVLSRYIAKYFHDMVLHVRELAHVVEPGGSVHYIVGNSKFFDVVIPVEKIYAAMFEHAGFEDARVETLRKRSSKKELFEYLVSARRAA
jgi:SAM-dependent methyltransferase